MHSRRHISRRLRPPYGSLLLDITFAMCRRELPEGDQDELLEFRDEFLTIIESIEGNERLVGNSYTNLAWVELFLHDYDAAIDHANIGLTLRHDHGERVPAVLAEHDLICTLASLAQGELERAVVFLIVVRDSGFDTRYLNAANALLDFRLGSITDSAIVLEAADELPPCATGLRVWIQAILEDWESSDAFRLGE